MRAEQRFIGFDILKFLAAFLIVCIHCPFPRVAGEYFTSITRIAVLIFFMISGFYYSDIQKNRREGQQIRKILLLMIFANVLYFIWKSLVTVVSGNGAMSYWSEVFTLKNATKFFLLNVSPFSNHLWYLGAILYVLIIVFVFSHLKLIRWLHIAAPLLLITDIVLGKYSLLLLGREFSYILVRNFICVGVPYFIIVMLIRKRTEKRRSVGEGVEKQTRERNSEKIKGSGIPVKWLILTIVFAITTFFERLILVTFDVNGTRDHYISTTFLAISAFHLFLELYRNKKPCKIEKRMATIGRKYSGGVYIVHCIFISVLAVVMKVIGMTSVYEYVAPVTVYGCSIAFMAITEKSRETIFHRGRISH